MRARGTRALLACLVFAFVLAASRYSEAYDFVGDDGGITLRYAQRFAAGAGLGYNDYERVNGASNLLNTLCLAGLLRAGLDCGTAVRVLGSLCLAASCGLMSYALLTHVSIAACALFLCLFAGNDALYAEAFNGLESPLLFVLIAALYASLKHGSPLWIGAVLGLLLWNKLDAGLAALAYAAVQLRRHPRDVLKAAALSGAIALPMIVWLWLRFGTPLPRSALTKLLEHRTQGFDALWFARDVAHKAGPAALLALGAVCVRERAVRVLLLWAALQAAAYSAIDLGAPYPWYCAGAILISLVLAVEFVHFLQTRALELAARRPSPGARAALACGLLALPLAAAEWNHGRSGLAQAFARVAHAGEGVDVPLAARSDLARQAAGAWLRQNSSATELLCTPYGLPSLEYAGPVVDYSGLNSSNGAELAFSSKYFLAEGQGPLSGPLASFPIVAEFQYALDGARYVLAARPDSEVARSGLRYRVTPLSAFAGLRVDSIRQQRVDGVLLEAIQIGPGAELRLELPAGARRWLRLHSDGASELELVWREPSSELAVEALPREGWYSLPVPEAATAGVLRARWSEGSRTSVAGLNVLEGTAPDPERQQLQSARWSRRVDYVHRFAIPCE